MGCPWCLMMPALTILQNIANHLELVKGAKGFSWMRCKQACQFASALLHIDNSFDMHTGKRRLHAEL